MDRGVKKRWIEVVKVEILVLSGVRAESKGIWVGLCLSLSFFLPNKIRVFDRYLLILKVIPMFIKTEF